MRADQRYRAVIFDMDGLMLDTERIAMITCKRAAEDFGYVIADEIYVQVIGRTVEDTCQIFCGALGADFPFYDIRKRRLDYTEEYIHRYGLPRKPGLIEVLELLQSCSVRKAVATSTGREEACARLRATDLCHGFDAIVGGDEVVHGKPAPDLFLLAAERLKITPTECIVPEDSEAGIHAARAAGTTPILVPNLKQPSDAVKALAYRIYPSLHEVRALFSNLFLQSRWCLTRHCSGRAHW
jgi:HAD superfamily hydrolase (TIGR01509 family)